MTAVATSPVPFVISQDREMTFGVNLIDTPEALQLVYQSLMYCSRHRKFDISITVRKGDQVMGGDSFGHYDREDLKTFLQELCTLDPKEWAQSFATFSVFDKNLFSQIKGHLKF